MTITSGKKLTKAILLFAAAYILYILFTGVFPFMHRKTVTEDFSSSVKVSEYYGDTPCVDRAALVEAPADGLSARLHIIDEAQEQLDVSYYAMHMGETTDLFLGALLDAADRGVHVRILVDGFFGGLTNSNRDYAVALGAHPNIELALYNVPNLLKPWTFNGRLHDKYIIADDRILLLGGRNIGDKYFAPAGYDKAISYDRDVLVYNTVWNSGRTGSVLFDVRNYMDTVWNSEYVQQPFGEDITRGVEKRQELQSIYDSFRAEHKSLFEHTDDDYIEWTYPVNRISFLHNDIQIGPKEPKVTYILGELLKSAEESVTLQSPYVILDPMQKQLMYDLGAKQIETLVLTNSLASSPNPVACTANFGDRDTLLKAGLRLWEYQGADSLHAKSYMIDDRMTVIGSYNLDPRSAYIDTELLLAIDSPEFAQHFSEVQYGYLEQSMEVNADGEYIANDNIVANSVPLLKKIMVYVLYLPVKLFKNLT